MVEESRMMTLCLNSKDSISSKEAGLLVVVVAVDAEEEEAKGIVLQARYQKKCCRGMDPMTFTRPVHSMRGTMTFVKLLNSALSSSLQHYECSAPTSSRQFCSLGNGIYKA
ncbi:unnamed protein product [Sphagnum troendelagicum]|uniref:Uncharacterized protein n=1 Tax=Sphagnum troendelagicum TaxID=128251 RepID=A0ABP0UZD8_9BRYO